MSSAWELLVQRKNADELANRIYCHDRKVHIYDANMNRVGDGVIELVGFNHLPPDSRELMKESLNIIYTRVRMDDGSLIWSYDHCIKDVEEAKTQIDNNSSPPSLDNRDDKCNDDRCPYAKAFHLKRLNEPSNSVEIVDIFPNYKNSPWHQHFNSEYEVVLESARFENKAECIFHFRKKVALVE